MKSMHPISLSKHSIICFNYLYLITFQFSMQKGSSIKSDTHWDVDDCYKSGNIIIEFFRQNQETRTSAWWSSNIISHEAADGKRWLSQHQFVISILEVNNQTIHSCPLEHLRQRSQNNEQLPCINPMQHNVLQYGHTVVNSTLRSAI